MEQAGVEEEKKEAKETRNGLDKLGELALGFGFWVLMGFQIYWNIK